MTVDTDARGAPEPPESRPRRSRADMPGRERFSAVFAHLGAVTAYARRRGSGDAEGIAAETMTIAWRRLDDVPVDDPRPWLFATARNLLLAEARKAARARAVVADEGPRPRSSPSGDQVGSQPPPGLPGIDPGLRQALRALAPSDLEALLLVAWEDLTPTQAARSLGVSPVAFRVRLLRARRRLRARLEASDQSQQADDPVPVVRLNVEGTR